MFFDDGRIDRSYVRLYFEKYVKLDPATTGHYFAALEAPMATADVISYSEFRETRFYREWAEPQGLVDFVSAVLDRSATSVAMFGMIRHRRDGGSTARCVAKLRLLIPHVRRAGSRAMPRRGRDTAKTHLDRIYAKTGSGRHADLMKLVAGFDSPITS